VDELIVNGYELWICVPLTYKLINLSIYVFSVVNYFT